jgi:hypothetical protein
MNEHDLLRKRREGVRVREFCKGKCVLRTRNSRSQWRAYGDINWTGESHGINSNFRSRRHLDGMEL